MAPSQRTIDYDAVLATTLDAYRPEMVNNIAKESVLMSAIKEKGGYRSQDGGDRIRIELMYGKTNVSSYSGYDVLDTTPADGMTTAFYDWKQIATPIAISRKEERKNSGKSKIISLLDSKIKQAEMSITEELNYQLLGKTVSGGVFIEGNDTKDITPLAMMLPKDPGGSVSIGNIDPSTYAWWRPKVVDGSTNGSSSQNSNTNAGFDLNTYAELRQAMKRTYNFCTRGPGGAPNMVMTDQVGYETYESSLEEKVRYGVENAHMAFDNILFKPGCPMYWDEQMPDVENGANYENPNATPLSTYMFLNTKFLEIVYDSQTDFMTTAFTKPENQDAKVAHILWYGNLTCSNRRKQGVLTGVSQDITS